jgi:imidazole glycerol-phosphate synthase subunit HisH
VKTVGIVDSGICNLDSVSRAVELCGGRIRIARRPDDLDRVSSIILPGVGSFAVGIQRLREFGLADALEEQVIGQEIPLLGLCLGMQLLAAHGTEGGGERGLGWIDGEVQRLEPVNAAERVPHIGWNEVQHDDGSSLMRGIPSGKDFYFVHSFHFRPRNDRHVVGRTPAYGGFAAVVSAGHIFGVQFHPEKSQKPGMQVLRNFLDL